MSPIGAPKVSQVHPQHRYIIEGYRILGQMLTVAVVAVAVLFGGSALITLMQWAFVVAEKWWA